MQFTFEAMSILRPHIILDNTFLLSTDRCLFWVEQKILILSDPHFGKTGHFRKSGIAIPQEIFKEDLQRFFTQLQLFKPTQVIIIGDMFHSHSNKEHDFFLKWRQDFANIPIHLVKGNHDILKESWYNLAAISIHECELTIDDFVFVHNFNDCIVPDKGYIFSGHIHPGITIRGIGKQSLHFACFYFAKQYAVLPAFSKFTGTYKIEPKAGESVFILADQSVVKLK